MSTILKHQQKLNGMKLHENNVIDIMKHIIAVMIVLIVSGCSSNEIKPGAAISDHFLKAESAYAKKNYALAKKHYEIVIHAYPGNIESIFKLANISMREKQWDKALKYYTEVIRIKPDYAKAHHNLAMLHLYKAKMHLNYYIANNESFDNKTLGKLIESIDDYSNNKDDKRTPLDNLADAVTAN